MFRRLLPALLLLLLCTAVASAQTCSPGYFSSTGSEPCQPCVDGFFAPSPGSVSCMMCSPGYVTDHPASTMCTSCSPGTYQSNFGQRVCFTCPDGSIAPYPGSANCQPCEAGYTSDATHTSCISLTTSLKRRSWSQLKQHYR